MIIEGYFFFSLKPYVVTPQRNPLDETIQIAHDSSSESHQRSGSDEGSQHMFLGKIKKNIPNYHQIRPLI